MQTHCDVIGALDAHFGVIATASLERVRFWSVRSGMKIGEWPSSGDSNSNKISGDGSSCGVESSVGSNVSCIALRHHTAVAAVPISIMVAIGDSSDRDRGGGSDGDCSLQ
jgi:hypothetical protein